MSDNEDDYSYDVEDFLLRIIFHNLYNFGSIVSYCQPYVDCTTECTKCPENGYEQIAAKVLYRIMFFINSFSFLSIYRSGLTARNWLLCAVGMI